MKVPSLSSPLCISRRTFSLSLTLVKFRSLQPAQVRSVNHDPCTSTVQLRERYQEINHLFDIRLIRLEESHFRALRTKQNPENQIQFRVSQTKFVLVSNIPSG